MVSAETPKLKLKKISIKIYSPSSPSESYILFSNNTLVGLEKIGTIDLYNKKENSGDCGFEIIGETHDYENDDWITRSVFDSYGVS